MREYGMHLVKGSFFLGVRFLKTCVRFYKTCENCIFLYPHSILEEKKFTRNNIN